nr:helix-turn-helix domain-containing protein [Kibdelosporangium sp. MJ126-NF4]CEL18550.1 Putative transcriptional regulator [Kibdelosporangium sp. MJ126-NF4]CTQ98034.1 Putative transcriptional regulator [Kibdelosporangium sp. MJ126-NF4]
MDEQQQRQQTAEVVLYWMRRRGLTRQVFADRMGRSVSWVDKIRNGDRQLDRLSVLRQIANVLDIDLATLIDSEQIEQARMCPDEREVEAIRNALGRYDVISNIFRPSGDVLPEPDLAKLERLVRYGWMAFQAANYQAIGELLPGLIRDAQAAVWQFDDEPRTTARTWLAWTYQLTAATAFKLGDAQLGWIAADRGIQIAEQTEDPTLIGSAARRVAHALSATHQSAEAVQLVRSAADRLSSHLATADRAFVSCFGMLLLKGSIAAARLHQAADVRDLQAEALTVAEQLGTDRNENWSAFGTTNVRVHQVSALADMQSGGLVIEASDTIPHGDLLRLPRERRASHLLDVTRGYLQWGKRDEAATTLLDADQLAPEEVRCRQLSRQVITDLVRSYPRGVQPPTRLAKIARAVGVAV